MDIGRLLFDLNQVFEVLPEELINFAGVQDAVPLPEVFTKYFVAVYNRVQNLLLEVLPDAFVATCL